MEALVTEEASRLKVFADYAEMKMSREKCFEWASSEETSSKGAHGTIAACFRFFRSP